MRRPFSLTLVATCQAAHGQHLAPPRFSLALSTCIFLSHQANVAIEIVGDTVRVLTSAQVQKQCPSDSAGARVADHLAAGGEEPWGV